MTEQEWTASEDPQAMLQWAGKVSDRSFPGVNCPISDRKLRLFVEGSRGIFRGEMTVSPHRSWADFAADVARTGNTYFGSNAPTHDPVALAGLLRDIVGNPFREVAVRPEWLTPTVLSLAQAAYEERGRKCLACNKWTDCKWCGNTRRIDDGTLDPVRLSILADALEEAGCDSERCKECYGSGTYTVQVRNAGLSAANGYGSATTYSEWRGCRRCGGDYDRKGSGLVPHPIIVHLRSSGPHVRGCFALDLILGKE